MNKLKIDQNELSKWLINSMYIMRVSQVLEQISLDLAERKSEENNYHWATCRLTLASNALYSYASSILDDITSLMQIQMKGNVDFYPYKNVNPQIERLVNKTFTESDIVDILDESYEIIMRWSDSLENDSHFARPNPYLTKLDQPTTELLVIQALIIDPSLSDPSVSSDPWDNEEGISNIVELLNNGLKSRKTDRIKQSWSSAIESITSKISRKGSNNQTEIYYKVIDEADNNDSDDRPSYIA